MGRTFRHQRTGIGIAILVQFYISQRSSFQGKGSGLQGGKNEKLEESMEHGRIGSSDHDVIVELLIPQHLKLLA